MATIESTLPQMDQGTPPLFRVSAGLALLIGGVFAWLLARWMTFSEFDWKPLKVELTLADLSGSTAYALYGVFIGVSLLTAFALNSGWQRARYLGLAFSGITAIGCIAYYWATRDFYFPCIVLSLAGMMLVALLEQPAWTINYPAAYWLAIFFVAPMAIVLFASLGERTLHGTIEYPAFSFSTLGVYFDDYARFLSRINGRLLYLEIFWRSMVLAGVNTILCLVFGYPFAYWIARQEQKYRNTLIFLVMIPFWTNFLVRTYAWMLILRDSGLINTIWTISLHELAVGLAPNYAFFSWLAEVTTRKLPLLFNQPAVFLGMFYGFFPFVVLPLYSNLEKLDWSLLEAAADLGANTWQSATRILLPLSMPGIVAGGIIVFIPSLGAYVTPDLLGGGKVVLLGNLLQQQFMTARDWPFGSAIGFIMMAMMLIAIMVYFRVDEAAEARE
jgi:spermidine/putrescine transport system permease protein